MRSLRAQTKIVAALLSVSAVVATPPQAWWAFAVYAGIVAGLARAGRVAPWLLLRRLALGAPVVLFAVLLPFVASGDRMSLGGVLTVSEPGLLAAWNLLAKAALGLCATALLTATTPIPDLVGGLARLRIPAAMVAIAGLMVRYVDVIAGDLRRMQVARTSRGHDPRWLWQAGAVASTLGALFVRTFERGERVHLAMASRGYDGTRRTIEAPPATCREWCAAMCLPALVVIVSGAAGLLT